MVVVHVLRQEQSPSSKTANQPSLSVVRPCVGGAACKLYAARFKCWKSRQTAIAYLHHPKKFCCKVSTGRRMASRMQATGKSFGGC
eukprot:6474936-Amphidinium_carterae.1